MSVNKDALLQSERIWQDKWGINGTERVKLESRVKELETALDSSNKTLRYVQEVSAHGHGAQLIKATLENNCQILGENIK